MKIIQISKANESGGGASRVAVNLSRGLNETGYDSRHMVSWSTRDFDETIEPLFKSRLIKKLRFRRQREKLGIFDLIDTESLFINKKKLFEGADIIHFHDILDTVSPKFIAKACSLGIPVLWTAHDCSPFTGGCIQPMGCEKYKTNCGPCPLHPNWPIHGKFDLTKQSQQIKRSLLKLQEAGKLTLIYPSDWIAKEAQKASCALEDYKVVHNGIDTDVFKPSETNKSSVRTELEIRENELVILFTAGHLTDPFKGFNQICEAIKQSKNKNITLLCVGQFTYEADQLTQGIKVKFAGKHSNQKELARYYSAADMGVTLSAADNFPLVTLEMLGCGLPVICYKTGGVAEAIKSNDYGWTLEPKDIKGVIEVIDNITLDRIKIMSKAAREAAISHFSLKTMTDNHIALYEKVIASNKK